MAPSRIVLVPFTFILASVAVACGDSRDPVRPVTHVNSPTLTMNRTQEQVIEEILLHYPPGLRSEARAYLEDTTAMIGSHRPEVATLMQELAALRLKDHSARAEDVSENAVPAEQRCRISVALVPGMAQGVRAVVIRRPNDGGRPLLLLRDDATGVELEFGLQMAARALSTFGEIVSEAHRIEYRGGTAGQSIHFAPRFDSGIALIRRALPRDIDGIGRVPALDVFTRRLPAP